MMLLRKDGSGVIAIPRPRHVWLSGQMARPRRTISTLRSRSRRGQLKFAPIWLLMPAELRRALTSTQDFNRDIDSSL
jgi:hypothetical protein